MTEQNPYGPPQYWTPPTYGQYDYAAAMAAAQHAAAEQAARAARRRRRISFAVAGAAVVTAGALGTSAALGVFDTSTTPLIAAAAQGATGSGGSGSGSGGTGTDPFGSGNGSDPFGLGNGSGNGSDPFGLGNGSGNGSGGSGSSGGSTGTATAAQQVGVVDIDTVLGYQSARAAGTGMILTSDGEVLTNNHVVNGATKVTVTVVSTHKTYTAKVVGTDPADDVAVLQLQNASGLATTKTADSSSVQVGDAVTGVGNAGGVGGTPSAATGTVTALDQTITASDEGGDNSETLTGMIETNADIQAGDSGGPLYNRDGQVIGMDSAASSGGVGTTAYAIPISKALSIANQIESGQGSSRIHIGATPFLGIELPSSSAGSLGGLGTPAAGAAIAGVVDGSPAAQAGLAAGDTITAFDGTAIDSTSALSAAIGQHKVGDKVSVSWTDSSGQSHTATVNLVAGPAN